MKPLFTGQEIETGLRDMGLHAGCVVVVHSSLSSLGEAGTTLSLLPRPVAKELAEFVDVVGVGFDGGRCQVPDLHVLGHATDGRIELWFARRHGRFLETGLGALKPTLGFAVRYSNVGRKRAERKWKT